MRIMTRSFLRHFFRLPSLGTHHIHNPVDPSWEAWIPYGLDRSSSLPSISRSSRDCRSHGQSLCGPSQSCVVLRLVLVGETRNPTARQQLLRGEKIVLSTLVVSYQSDGQKPWVSFFFWLQETKHDN